MTEEWLVAVDLVAVEETLDIPSQEETSEEEQEEEEYGIQTGRMAGVAACLRDTGEATGGVVAEVAMVLADLSTEMMTQTCQAPERRIGARISTSDVAVDPT